MKSNKKPIISGIVTSSLFIMSILSLVLIPMITPANADLLKVQSSQFPFINNSSSATCTLSSVTQGDLILAGIGESYTIIQAPVSISDSVNTYTNIVTKTLTTGTIQAAIYLYSAIATQSVTLSITGTLASGVGNNGVLACIEISGSAALLPNNTFSNSGTLNSASANPVTINLGSSFTPTQGELIFSMLMASYCGALGTESPPFSDFTGSNMFTSTACNGATNIGSMWRWSINPNTLASPTNVQWIYNWGTAWQPSNSANWVEVAVDYVPKVLTTTTTFTTTISSGTGTTTVTATN